MKTISQGMLAIPWFWNIVQRVLGAEGFKQDLYASVLHPPGTLLDFGCASGHIADIFSKFEYYGVDIDPIAIADAAERFKSFPNMHFIAADIRTRPFQPEFFDEVLLAGTVHHLALDLFPIILRELHHCLKPGGVLHVIDPVHRPQDAWSRRLIRSLDQGKFTRTPEQILETATSLNLFEIGTPTFHTPYGQLIKDCDFMHLPLTKKV